MKNLSTYTLLVLFVSGAAWAQQDGKLQTSPTQTTVIELPASEPAPAQTPQVVILPATQQPVIEQPKTMVEAAPLVKSRAEQLRDARKDVEIQTEQKIVEKLEEARMEDERERSERLFGDRFNKQADKDAAQYPVVPVQQVVPVQTVEVDNTDEKLDAMKTDIIESVRSDLNKAKAKPEAKSSTYIGATLGGGEYPDLMFVDGNESFGFVVGTVNDNFVLEAAYIYSNYYLSESIFVYKDLDQHNIMASAKYNILSGRVKPQLGAVGSYTMRKYTDKTQGFNGFPNQTGNEYESTGFDAGLVIGLDIEVSGNFSLGVDYRYMTNMISNDDNRTPLINQVASGAVDELVENSDYQIISVSGKVTF